MSAKHRKGLTMKAVAIFMLLGFLFPAVNTILAQEVYPMYYPCRCETGEWGYVDKDNEWAIRPIYDAVLYETNGGMYPVSVGGKWGYVGVSGEPLTDVAYDGFASQGQMGFCRCARQVCD